MKLSLPFEAKPWKVYQVWGIYNSIYQQFGFSRHNGVDFAVAWDGLVRSPFTCEVVEVGDKPTGAGLYVSVLSKDIYESPFGECQVRIDYMHLKSTLGMFVGKTLDVGNEIAPQNNTGFSTGPHTHGQYRWVIKGPNNLIYVDINDANNSFDPTPYRNGQYAEDILKEKLTGELKNLQLSYIQLLQTYIKRLIARLDWQRKSP
jgi:murein DD-endopeptidase MepM/ murein hydrolase activator NlpD